MIKKEILNDYLEKELSHNVMFIFNIDNHSRILIEDYLNDNSITYETYEYLYDIVNYMEYLFNEINPEIVEEIKISALSGSIEKVLCTIISYADYSNMLCQYKRSDKDFCLLENMYRYVKGLFSC